jgi:hypothetical protein
MNRNGPLKMDARAAWNAWSAEGSDEGRVDFLDRVEAWTDGTAAQLSRGSIRHFTSYLSRDEAADRLRHHLGLLAAGEPLSYMDALDQARQNVIRELRPKAKS